MLLAATAGLVGLNVSYLGDLPTGPFIVVTLAAFFSVAWLFSPRYGVVAPRSGCGAGGAERLAKTC